MKKIKKIDLSKFESLKENNQGQLIGGFMLALKGSLSMFGSDGSGTTNNCYGGNCVSGCQTTTNKLIC